MEIGFSLNDTFIFLSSSSFNNENDKEITITGKTKIYE